MKFKFFKIFKKEFIILFVILIIGSFFRLQGVFTNSFAFTYDVGRDMLSLWDIAYNHKIILIGATTGIQGVFYGPWWYYLLVPFFVIFSGNPQGIALVMALIGIATIALGFYFGKIIGGNYFGLLMAALISVSGNLISLSSQIWNPNIAPFFVILTFILLEKIYLLKSKVKLRYFFALGVLLALNIDIEILWGVLFSLGILISLFIVLKKEFKIGEFIFISLGGLIILSPRIIFELRHNFLMTNSFKTFLLGNTTVGSPNLIDILLNRISILYNQFCSTLALENQWLGLIIAVFILFCFILMFKKLNKKIRELAITSIIILFVFLFGIIFFSHDIWPHYLVGLPIIYVLLLSICLYMLKQYKSVLFSGLFFSIIFMVNLNPIIVYKNFFSPLWVGDASVYRNQLEVIDYVYNQSKGKQFKYVTYTPPIHDYTYQYLFKWYGPLKYKYDPSLNARLAFFIIEPDTQNPNRPKVWLEERAKDGKIIKSHTLGSGIVIQTRVN